MYGMYSVRPTILNEMLCSGGLSRYIYIVILNCVTKT